MVFIDNLEPMILEGKAYWCSLFQPNTKFNSVYQISLMVNKSLYDKYKKQSYPTKKILEGYCIVMRTKTKEGYKPIVVDKKQQPLVMFGEIQNGSNVKVKFDTYETNTTYGRFKGFNLIAVMLLDDVPKLF